MKKKNIIVCLVCVFLKKIIIIGNFSNKNNVFNLRREKLPCISINHNHYLSLSLSLRYSTQFLQKKFTKFQFAKPIKQPNTPNLKTKEEDSVQERKRPKKKKGRRRQRAREREREREHMILKTGLGAKPNLPPIPYFFIGFSQF